MTVFVDAQILVWAIFDRSRLNATARSVLTNADNTLLVSEATLWELLNKVGRNKLLIAGSDIAVVHDLIQALGVTFVPIQRSHILQAASLPHHHSDPFDRHPHRASHAANRAHPHRRLGDPQLRRRNHLVNASAMRHPHPRRSPTSPQRRRTRTRIKRMEGEQEELAAE